MRTLILCLVLTGTNPHTELLDAIKQVESGGNAHAIGDGGASIGAYQIGRAYFKDAVEFNKSLRKYKYSDVVKDHVARLIIRAYWNRYCTEKRLGHKPTDEDRARLHNGGPQAHKFQNKAKEANLKKYWAKIKAVLK